MTTPPPAAPARIRAVMDELGRDPFLPAEQRRFSDLDRPLPIGHGQTNSQPSTVAAMITLLEVSTGQRILDVGSGSGWTTAILARLVGSSGCVIGCELVPALRESAAAVLAGLDMPWAEVRQARIGTLGAPVDGPYDRILVSAGAQTLPRTLVEQLAPDGIMVIPVASTMLRVHRTAAGPVDITEHGRYSFVPLIDG